MATVQLPAPYPLAWPPGRPRTPSSERLKGRYSLRLFSQAIATVDAEVHRWHTRKRGARLVDWQLSSYHIGREREHADPGVALWFTLAVDRTVTGSTSLMVLSCDRFVELAQNVRALSLTMERLRLVDEIGAYSLVAAVEGARALPPPERTIDWRGILGVAGRALRADSLIVAEAAYRALARDAGEGSGKLRELNLAIEAARRELK